MLCAVFENVILTAVNSCTAVFEIAVWTTVSQVENQVFVRKSLILARFLTKIRRIFEMLAKSLLFLCSKEKNDFDVTKIPGSRIFQEFFDFKFAKFWKQLCTVVFTAVSAVYRYTAVLKQMCGIWKWVVQNAHRSLCDVLCCFVQSSTLPTTPLSFYLIKIHKFNQQFQHFFQFQPFETPSTITNQPIKNPGTSYPNALKSCSYAWYNRVIVSLGSFPK